MIKKEIISTLKCTTPDCRGELKLQVAYDSYLFPGKVARYYCKKCGLTYFTENYEVIVQYDE